MQVHEILNGIQGLKGGGGQWTGRCPAHDDTHNSLSIATGKNGRVLLNCHAGCTLEAITAALGISKRDLFQDPAPGREGFTMSDLKPVDGEKPRGKKSPSSAAKVTAVYQYPNGAQKLRRADKSFVWRQPDGRGGWVYNRKGLKPCLYVAGSLEGLVFAVEGEKDADNLHKLGYNAVTGEDGAGRDKWRREYTEQLKGLRVCIIPDNDAVGKEYAGEVADKLTGIASRVQLLDLSTVWDDMPEHADISDCITKYSETVTREMLRELMDQTPDWAKKDRSTPFSSCFKTLEDITEEEARWVIPGWIPEEQIALLAADGGVGKTTLWCHIIAALSAGKPCLLDPPDVERAPARVAFLTTEDSVKKKLRKKIREAGGNLRNIITPDFTGDDGGQLLRALKFGTPEMEGFIKSLRPALCVFDPIQGFIPPELNMSHRNVMRDRLSSLLALGEKYHSAFLLICHSNKRKGASGRDRISESADLWDIARSVMMAGYTDEQGVRYLSNEKNNYAELQETILFTIDDSGQAIKTGTSWKRDKDYMQAAAFAAAPPVKEDCKDWIINELKQCAEGQNMSNKELEERARAKGYTHTTVRNAKKELKNEGRISMFSTGNPTTGKQWFIQSLDVETVWDDLGEVVE